jgi:hypothetical protein
VRDLNALFVGLARASASRRAKSTACASRRGAFGYRSLGAGLENVTRAQALPRGSLHRRLRLGPGRSADVRKVVLEEKAQPITLADPVVPAVRKALFGGWEMNWLAYNDAHDVKLPGSNAKPIGFLMYPQCETAEGLRDSLDPDNFKYTITARKV